MSTTLGIGHSMGPLLTRVLLGISLLAVPGPGIAQSSSPGRTIPGTTVPAPPTDPLVSKLLGALKGSDSDALLGITPQTATSSVGDDADPETALLSALEQIPVPRIEAPADPAVRAALDKELIEAVQRGDLVQTLQSIRAGADVNAMAEHGAPVLGLAASNGHKDIVRALIDAGADIHFQAERGQTALNVAAARGHSEIVRVLVDAGVDVNERITSTEAPKNLQGATPLYVASDHGQLETAKALIVLGANVNARAVDGGTPLFGAAESGNVALARALIEAGASVSIANKRGATPLIVAVDSDSPEMMLLLVDAGADPNAKTSNDNPPPFGGMTPLMFAAHTGNEQAVLTLILSNADVAAINEEGRTASSLAAEQGYHDIVALLENPGQARRSAEQVFNEELVDAAMQGRWSTVRLLTKFDVDVNWKDMTGATALIKATREGSRIAVDILLAAGADVDAAETEFGATALMIAASHGHNEIVRALIEAGADTDRKALAGWTSLMLAASEGHADIVSTLLHAGADPMAVNDVGKTALDIAKSGKKAGSTKIIDLLEAALAPDRRDADDLPGKN